MPQQKLESCALLIESGGRTSQTRVAAFTSRGSIHLSQRNYDHASDDDNAARPCLPAQAPNRSRDRRLRGSDPAQFRFCGRLCQSGHCAADLAAGRSCNRGRPASNRGQSPPCRAQDRRDCDHDGACAFSRTRPPRGFLEYEKGGTVVRYTTSTKRSGSIHMQRRRFAAAPMRSDSSGNMIRPLQTTAGPHASRSAKALRELGGHAGLRQTFQSGGS
jgi:hypothetical protein